jgi:hypothetical protein
MVLTWPHPGITIPKQFPKRIKKFINFVDTTFSMWG